MILQLNRYVFVGEETKKIRDNVGVPKFLSLDEYVADDVTQPPEWKCSMPSRYTLRNCGESVQPVSTLFVFARSITAIAYHHRRHRGHRRSHSVAVPGAAVVLAGGRGGWVFFGRSHAAGKSPAAGTGGVELPV